MHGRYRIHFPGATYHVMARGNAGETIFLGEREFESFLIALEKLKKQTPFQLHAYCLMDNHLHMLVQVEECPLSSLMRRLLTSWAKRVNLLRERIGHVFQGRYKAILCRDDSYFLELLRYIHMNPVGAGLVRDPREWPWSSHREYVGVVPPRFIDRARGLALFGRALSGAVQAYESFVLARIDERERDVLALDSDPGATSFGPILLRHEEVERPSLERILLDVCEEQKLEPSLILGRGRTKTVSVARKRFLFEALRGGYAMTELANFLGISRSGVSRAVGSLKTQQEQQSQ